MGQLLLVPHGGSRAQGHRREGTNAPALLLTGNRNNKLVETVRKKKNLSPGSDCCLFAFMTGCPLSFLSWQSTSECMSCVCLCCCFLISSQCRDAQKCIFGNSKCHCPKQKPLVFTRERAAYRCPCIPSVGACLGVSGAANPE